MALFPADPHMVKSDDDAFHICLTNCHFLLLTVNITEGPKNEIMGKTGLHSSVQCRDSILKHFCFTGCPEKMQKGITFETML